jgi:hypothetical protein
MRRERADADMYARTRAHVATRRRANRVMTCTNTTEEDVCEPVKRAQAVRCDLCLRYSHQSRRIGYACQCVSVHKCARMPVYIRASTNSSRSLMTSRTSASTKRTLWLVKALAKKVIERIHVPKGGQWGLHAGTKVAVMINIGEADGLIRLHLPPFAPLWCRIGGHDPSMVRKLAPYTPFQAHMGT